MVFKVLPLSNMKWLLSSRKQAFFGNFSLVLIKFSKTGFRVKSYFVNVNCKSRRIWSFLSHLLIQSVYNYVLKKRMNMSLPGVGGGSWEVA